MVKFIEILILSLLSACAYRAGGMGKEADAKPTWMPMWMRQSWVRDWLCPMCVLALWLPSTWFKWFVYCVTFGHTAIPAQGFEMIMWLLAYGATGGMLTTYWDWLFKYDNFWFSGFMVGLAGLFLIGLNQPWMPLVGRSLLLAILWGGWSALIGKDWLEEYGRGFFLVLTMGLIYG